MDNPDEFNLASPAYQIDFYLGEDKVHKSVILSRLNNNVSNVKEDSRPQVMTVDSLFIRDIDKDFFDFRDKKISEFDKNIADSVVVTQGDSILYFVKDTSDTWLLGGAIKVKDWKMNALLTTVNNLKAKKFIMENVSSTDKYGLNRPERKVEIYHRSEKVQFLLVSRHNDKKVAFSPGAQKVVEIEDISFNNLEVKVDDFIDTSIKTTEEID